MTGTGLLALIPALLAPPAGSDADVYERAMESALERARQRLERSLDLREDHSTFDNPWVVESEHYSVRSTHSWFLTDSVAKGLETMLGHFQATMGSSHAPAEPWAINVYGSLAEYNAFGNQFGADHSSFYGSFFSGTDDERAVATYYDGNMVQLQMWATHSAFHQWLDSAYNRTPPTWLVEGMASYFSLFWDSSYGPNEFDRLRRGNAFRPLAGVLQDDIAAYGPNPHDRFIQLGMLMTYLLVYREDTRTTGDIPGPMAEYLSLRMVADDFQLHPVHELLTTDVARLEADFMAFEFPR